MMKEQYTSPEVKLVSFVSEDPIAFFSINGEDLFESVARVEVEEDIPFFFEWLS